MTMKVRLYFCFYALLMAFASLFSGCSADDSTPSEAADEIRFNADVWRVMEGTRATTFDNDAAIQGEGAFTCTIYDANTTNEHFDEQVKKVVWNTNHWEFENTIYRWPTTGALDFFAYMPAAATIATDAPYISGPTYTTARTPQFSCTNLTMTNSGQSTIKEFVYALTINQDKQHQGESGVTMTFKHPFARINMQLSSSQEDIHINSITFKGIINNGICSFDGSTSTWTSSGDATNFVATLNDNYKANDVIGTFIMIPQSWTGAIDVNITWDNWGTSVTETLSTTVPTVTWLPGYSYTYTFTINKAALIVDIEKFTEQW